MSGFLILEADGAGSHPAAWRAGRTAPASVLGPAGLREVALAAESAGFHALSYVDGPLPEGPDTQARLNALQRAAFVGPLTHAIGLLPEVDTVYTEPFHVATQLASLDYVSQGRGGWLLAASDDAREAAAVGRSVADGHRRRAEAGASVKANRRLWDSWEDDAVIKDVDSGRYLDADRLHYADFQADLGDGEGYFVKGPSIIPRPLQGQLPVVAPAGLVSADGPLTPRDVDAVLVSGSSLDRLRTELSQAREAFGARSEGGPAVIAELDVVLDARGLSAADRLGALDAATPWNSGRARFVGTAEGLADLLEELLALADGVRLHPAVLDVELPELSALTLPVVRSRGLLRIAAPGDTFRSVLGLERAVNRYSTEAAQSVVAGTGAQA